MVKLKSVDGGKKKKSKELSFMEDDENHMIFAGCAKEEFQANKQLNDFALQVNTVYLAFLEEAQKISKANDLEMSVKVMFKPKV